MKKSVYDDALRYHEKGRPGKIEVVPTKPHETQYDLSLAYTPGVAQPCREIQRDPEEIYHYTSKGNLVAVVSNGTAVLGLGDIGPGAGKPVMEGKGMLFKIFADIDVFDIESKLLKQFRPHLGASTWRISRRRNVFMLRKRLKRNWIFRFFMMISMERR